MASWSELLAAMRRDNAWEVLDETESAPMASIALLSRWRKKGFPAFHIGALLWTWRHSSRPIVWALDQVSAAQVGSVRPEFIPPRPPSSWRGGCILAETLDGGPLVAGFHALGACFPYHDDEEGEQYLLAGIGAMGVFTTWTLSVGDRGDVASLSQYKEVGDEASLVEAFRWLVSLGLFLERSGRWWRVGPAGRRDGWERRLFVLRFPDPGPRSWTRAPDGGPDLLEGGS